MAGVCVSVCPSVSSRCSVEKVERIELVLAQKLSSDYSAMYYNGIGVSSKIRILPSRASHWHGLAKRNTFRLAEVAAGGHLAANVSQRPYHRQTFAIAFLMLLMLMPMSRQQCILHFLSMERIQLPRSHHAVQHQICTAHARYLAKPHLKATVMLYTLQYYLKCKAQLKSRQNFVLGARYT